MTDPPDNRTAQQDAERRHIEAFLEAAHINRDAVEYGDRPDAVLVLHGRRVGLEHRELTEEDLAGNERNLLVLEERLHDEMARLGVPGDIQVAVSVNAAEPFFSKRRQVEALAANIAKAAAAKVSSITVECPVRVPAVEVAPKDALGMDLIVVSKHPRRTDGPYAIVSPAFWGPVDSTVRDAVRKKNLLVSNYRTQRALDEVWLLLVTGESWVQATDPVLTEYVKVSSQFDRVYLLDVRTTAVQRLDERAEQSQG